MKKIYTYIAISIVFLLFLIYGYIMYLYNSLQYKLFLTKIDLTKLFNFSNGASIKIGFRLELRFGSSISLPKIKNVDIKLYYNGSLIGKLDNPISEIQIIGNTLNTVSDQFVLVLNNQVANALLDVYNNKPVIGTIIITFSVIGIPFTVFKQVTLYQG